MSKTRREFLAEAAVGLAAAATSAAGVAPAEAQDPSQQPAGAPPAFGTGPGVGPQVSVTTFSEAEKLVQIELTKPQLEMAASSWRGNLASVYERRTGPHKLGLPPSVVPYSSWNPVLPGRKAGPDRDQFVRTKTDPGSLPKNEDEIAFAPVTPPLPLGRDSPNHFRAPHANLFEAPRAVQSETPLRHHPHQRFGHRASQAGRH